jgi:hypothetical protein
MPRNCLRRKGKSDVSASNSGVSPAIFAVGAALFSRQQKNVSSVMLAAKGQFEYQAA